MKGNPVSSRFINEPVLDFIDSKSRDHVQKALKEVSLISEKSYPLQIGGKPVRTNRLLTSLNPSHPDQIVGKVFVASFEEVEKAIQLAKKAFLSWKKESVEKRASLVERLAELILENRFKLIALEVLEVGKNWKEADGDVTEAVDFCRFYAREMRRLEKPQRIESIPGEEGWFTYEPRGVSVVIAPWNFPLAILTGMAVSALVSGNTIIMKPAEQSSVIGATLMELILEAGFPENVVHFLPGYGHEVGEYLVKHKDISIISFTGSNEVGLKILKHAAYVAKGQNHVKTCVLEMGGKNAIIIDNDADLDEALSGVLNSAFGFQGQKCSACSRVIVLEESYDLFLKRLTSGVESLPVLPAEDPKSFIGPVIDKEAKKNIENSIEEAKKTCELAFSQPAIPEEGYFVSPTVFTNVPPWSTLAQKEIFGPVLAVMKAKNGIDEAIRIANDTPFALTGGLYSRSPINIENAKQNFNVGNLYINRKITGALVHRHPFGGFKMSGLGHKTGSSHSLFPFLLPKVSVENKMRREFVPFES